MAIAVKRGFGGGGAKPKQIFLYKNGVDNTAVTGGLTKSGYTFASGYTDNGYVNFETDAIRVDLPNGAKASVAFGTAIVVDVTDIASIIIKRHNQNQTAETQQTQVVDVSTISGQYYISVVAWQDTASTALRMGVVLSTSKSNTWSNAVANNGSYDNTTYRMFVDEIELVPKDKTQIDKNIIVDNAGKLNPKYLLQGIASQKDVAVEVTRTQSSGVHGYIIGFDFTNISKLIFTIYSGASGYIYVRSTDGADQLKTITNDTSHILTYEVDVSAYTGEQPIIIACNNYATIQIRQLTAT